MFDFRKCVIRLRQALSVCVCDCVYSLSISLCIFNMVYIQYIIYICIRTCISIYICLHIYVYSYTHTTYYTLSIASWNLPRQPALSRIVIHIQVAHIPVSRHIDCNTPNPELTGLPLQELPARFLRSPDGWEQRCLGCCQGTYVLSSDETNGREPRRTTVFRTCGICENPDANFRM